MRMIFRCDPALSEHLPRPVRGAQRAAPDWLRTMPANARSEIHGRDIRTVKQCPPFVDAMAYGVMIPLPCDVAVNHGVIFMGLEHSRAVDTGTSARSPELSRPGPIRAYAAGTETDRAAIKFNSFWTIELDPGWSLFSTHPVNREDLPFRTIIGTGGC